MKYFIRAVKSVLYFVVIFAVITSILFLFSKQKASGLTITDMFQPGSLPKLVIFFVVFGIVYPFTAFFKRNLYSNKDYAAHKDLIAGAMEDLGYEVEKEDADTVTFRKKTFWQRLSRVFFEDRITMSVGENPIVVEGYRKDVMRVISALSYKIRKEENPEVEE